MRPRSALISLCSVLLSWSASAQVCGPLPNTLTNNTPADATQVMQNFTTLLTCINSLAATPTGPQGRLTLQPGVPVMTADYTSATMIAPDGQRASSTTGCRSFPSAQHRLKLFEQPIHMIP